jgi:hypothetical protein
LNSRAFFLVQLLGSTNVHETPNILLVKADFATGVGRGSSDGLLLARADLEGLRGERQRAMKQRTLLGPSFLPFSTFFFFLPLHLLFYFVIFIHISSNKCYSPVSYVAI